MNAYLRMFRMINAVMGVVGALVASFIAAGTGIVDCWQNVLIMAAVVFLFVAGGNSINDSIDYEIDKVSHPERPVPKGEITPRQARNVGYALLLGSFAVSFLTLDIAAIILVLIAVILMVAYELTLKQRGFVGNVTIAVLTGMVFLVGAAMVGPWTENLYIAAMAAAVSVGREISKDIEDMEGDEGRLTLPMRIGVRNASIVACIFYLLGVAMSVIPLVTGMYSILYAIVVVADAFFVIATVSVFSAPHKAQKMAKFGMLWGLVAFILGAIYI